jgi:hypothetical protein
MENIHRFLCRIPLQSIERIDISQRQGRDRIVPQLIKLVSDRLVAWGRASTTFRRFGQRDGQQHRQNNSPDTYLSHGWNSFRAKSIFSKN